MAKLADVYLESNAKLAGTKFRSDPDNLGLLYAESDFYSYMKEFLRDPDTCCALWCDGDRYISAVRIEPFEDGMLLSGLETSPEDRCRGAAGSLLKAVCETLANSGCNRLYSHIARDNKPSLAVHKRCGFLRHLGYAKCVDGSILRSMDTYCLQLK